MAQECLVTTSTDFGLGDLPSIVIFLQAQAADTPRDHCMVFRVCSGGLEPERPMPGNAFLVNGGLSAFVIFTSPSCGGSRMCR